MYGLLALGFYVTYSVSSTVNFSQGSSMMLGAVLCYTFGITLGWGVPAGAVLALAGCALWGALVERFAVRPFVGGGSNAWLMSTVAVGNRPSDGVRHLAVRLPASQERLPPVGRTVDPAGDRPEHALGERPRVLLQLLLALAQREINGHDRHLLPVSFLSRVLLPHAQPAAAVTIAPAFAHRGDGINALEPDRLLQFSAQIPGHLVLHGITSALASGRPPTELGGSARSL